MAFPWAQEETWDDGTRGNFDAETDVSSILDFPHYLELGRGGFAPWQGGHALRLALSGTAVANIEETAGFDTAVGATIAIWLPVCLGANLLLNDGDAVILFALQSAGPVNEVVFGVRRSGADYQWFAGETGATNTLTVVRHSGRWHQIELVCAIAAGTGTIDFYVDGGQVGAQITGLTQAAITQAQLGAISGTAAGDAGTILIGGIIADDLRIYPRARFPLDTQWITRDKVAFVGPCEIDSVELTGTSTDATLTILDTDIFESTRLGFSREPVVYIRNVTASDQSPGQNLPVKLAKGAYVQLTGTNPQGWISVCKGPPVKSHAGYLIQAKGS